MAYSKLHSSIVNSSLWTEPDNVRLLFITLLAMCDRDGYVYGSRGGLERAANIDILPYQNDVDPWQRLMSPDADSSDRVRAPENDGRRIEEVSGGFHLLNFEYYRGLRNDDDRREQNRAAQAKYRVSQSKPTSARVSQRQPPSSHTETEADAAQKKKQESQNLLAPLPQRVSPVVAEQFANLWDEYPRKRGKAAAEKAFRRQIKTPGDLEAIRSALKNYREEIRILGTDETHTLHGSTWFNDRWRDYEDGTWSPPMPPANRGGNGRQLTTADFADYDVKTGG